MTPTKQQLRQERAPCRHFDGIQNDACKLGVDYDTVRIPRETAGDFPRIACLRPDGKAWCEKRDPFTAAEIEQQEVEMTASTNFVLAAMHAIVKEGAQNGTIRCPKCDGELRYGKAPGNGHIRAACSTPDCLRFMS